MKPESASEETTWHGPANGALVRKMKGEQRHEYMTAEYANALEKRVELLQGQLRHAWSEHGKEHAYGQKLEKRVVEAEAKAALADDLAEQLRDCIAEVEGKAYLKPYVKAVYDEVLARYDAIKASANGEEKNDG